MFKYFHKRERDNKFKQMIKQNTINQFLNINPELHTPLHELIQLIDSLKSTNPDLYNKINERVEVILASKCKIVYKTPVSDNKQLNNTTEDSGVDTTIKGHYKHIYKNMEDELEKIHNKLETISGVALDENNHDQFNEILCNAFKGTYAKASDMVLTLMCYKDLKSKMDIFKLVYNLD